MNRPDEYYMELEFTRQVLADDIREMRRKGQSAVSILRFFARRAAPCRLTVRGLRRRALEVYRFACGPACDDTDARYRAQALDEAALYAATANHVARLRRISGQAVRSDPRW
jgi:hypothetical protein